MCRFVCVCLGKRKKQETEEEKQRHGGRRGESALLISVETFKGERAMKGEHTQTSCFSKRSFAQTKIKSARALVLPFSCFPVCVPKGDEWNESNMK